MPLLQGAYIEAITEPGVGIVHWLNALLLNPGELPIEIGEITATAINGEALPGEGLRFIIRVTDGVSGRATLTLRARETARVRLTSAPGAQSESLLPATLRDARLDLQVVFLTHGETREVTFRGVTWPFEVTPPPASVIR